MRVGVAFEGAQFGMGILVLTYRKILRIRPPFDAQKLTPKRGGGLICEDLTSDIIDQ